MHFFDPTVDWPKDLLDPLAPELFIVQSKISIDSSPPWNDPSENSPWNTPWVEYAALDKEEQFINMTFFKTRFADRNEKQRISERSDELDDETRSIGWYKSTSSIDDYFATLQKTNTIRCRKIKSLPRAQTSPGSGSPITFRKIGSHRLRQALDGTWDYLMIEPVDESPDREFSVPAGWEAEIEQIGEAVSRDRPLHEPESQAEMLRLYIVASSKKLDSDQPTGGGLADENVAMT